MKIFRLAMSIFVAIFVLGSMSSPVFAKSNSKAKASKKQCEKVFDHIFELAIKNKEKSDSDNDEKFRESYHKAYHKALDEAKHSFVPLCQETITKKQVKCMVSANDLEQYTHCNDDAEK